MKARITPEPRNARIRAAILSESMRIGVERATLWSRGEKLAGDACPVLRNALAFEHLLDNVRLLIRDEERIAGNKTVHLLGLPWFVERGDINWILATEIKALGRRRTNRVVTDEADRLEIARLLKLYKGRTALSGVYHALRREGLLKKPAPLSPAEIRALAMGLGARGMYETARRWFYPTLKSPRILFSRSGNPEYLAVALNGAYGLLSFQGHVIFGHDRVIQKGYDGIAAEADLEATNLDPDDPQRQEKLRFYEAVKICCRAATNYASRLALHAEGLSVRIREDTRRKELEDMAQSLRKVAGGVPTSFREAVQSIWLSKLLLELYHPKSTISLGRIDRMLAPFYERDVESGRITAEEARGYLEELFLKIWTCTLYLGPGVQETGSQKFAGYQAVTIGGTDEKGRDATSPLTFLCVDAMDAVRPVMNLCVRLHSGSPQGLFQRVTEAISGGVSLAVYNDEIYAEALRKLGVSREHARDYAIVGCVEQVSASRTGGSTGTSQLNLAALVDMALRNGSVGLPVMRMVSGGKGYVQEGFRLPESFGELMTGFEKQLDHAIDEIVKGVNVVDREYTKWPTPFLSMTIEGCLATGLDITAGGALYDVSAVTFTGLANAADSLMAVKRAVYEEEWLSLENLLRAMDRNYRGREALRRKLLNRLPKFGNDFDEVDEIARRIMDMAFQKICGRSNIRGGRFSPAYVSLALHILFGQTLGATPDGRLAGTPICNSLSPVNGTERNGTTAVLNSITKIDTSRLSTGAAVNLKIHPLALRSEEAREKFVHLLRTFFGGGGPQLQVTLADAETLRHAMREPEKYPDLLVKVGGYSALFTDLGEDIQKDIIARSEQGL